MILHDGGADTPCQSAGGVHGRFSVFPLGISCDSSGGVTLIGPGNWVVTAIIYVTLALGALVIVRAELLQRGVEKYFSDEVRERP